MASRTKNFSVAADVLCITPSAVSHQIKALETFLGRQLFVRNNRCMELTQEGEIYAQKLFEVFARIEEATSMLLSSSQAPRLIVHVAPSIAQTWLMPRLSGFLNRHSSPQIQIVTNLYANQSVIDCEIRYGHGKWPGLEACLLWMDQVQPLVSAAGPSLSKLTDLAVVPLIHTRSRQRGWKAFFDFYGMRHAPGPNGLFFDRTVLALDAAVAGLGVALESPYLARRLIADGTLKMPLGSVGIEDEGYYFVHPAGGSSKEIELFKDWLLEQVRTDHGRDPLDVPGLSLA